MHTKINKSILLLFLLVMSMLHCSMLNAATMNAATAEFNSAEISKMTLLMKKKINSRSIQHWVKTIQNNQNNTTSYFGDVHERAPSKRRAAIMILISSSISIRSLHRYLMDGAKISTPLVLRGLVHNSFIDTAKFIHSVLMGTLGGVEVDPIVFEKLKIKSVPAFIVLNRRGLNCLNQSGCIPTPENYDLIYGQVTLRYALREILNRGRVNPNVVKAALLKLRETRYV